MVDKLPFPDHLLSLKCNVKITDSGINDEGEPNIVDMGSFFCIFSEHTKHIQEEDGTRVDLIGKIIIKGDIAPNISKITSGEVILGNKTMQIHSASRPRNPDGTVHHTTLEVM